MVEMTNFKETPEASAGGVGTERASCCGCSCVCFCDSDCKNVASISSKEADKQFNKLYNPYS